MAYTKTTWVNDESPDIDADNLNKMEQGIADAQFPDGGVSGQLLSKTINGTEWVDAPNSAVWGLIQGTLSDQTDLAYALANTGKVDTVNGIQPDVYKNVQVDIELTKAEYDALPSSKESDGVNYWIKDGTNIPQASVISADGVMYTNSQTVKGALDSQASSISDLNNSLNVGAYNEYASSVSSGALFRMYRIGRLRFFAFAGHNGGSIQLNASDFPFGSSLIFPAFLGYGSSWTMGDINIDYSTGILHFRDTSGNDLAGTYVRCSGCYFARS